MMLSGLIDGEGNSCLISTSYFESDQVVSAGLYWQVPGN
mgnify:CR=1 FL=1